MIFKLPLVLAVLLAPSWARADWTDPSTAYRCDTQAGTFSVISAMDASSDEGQTAVPHGFERIAEGREVKCQLGTSDVAVQFDYQLGVETGTCSGITTTTVRNFIVDGKKLFRNAELFNHHCYLDLPALHSVQVRRKSGGVAVEICRAKWDWGKKYHDVQCSTSDLSAFEAAFTR
jgi:hypothetical protein